MIAIVKFRTTLGKGDIQATIVEGVDGLSNGQIYACFASVIEGTIPIEIIGIDLYEHAGSVYCPTIGVIS